MSDSPDEFLFGPDEPRSSSGFLKIAIACLTCMALGVWLALQFLTPVDDTVVGAAQQAETQTETEVGSTGGAAIPESAVPKRAGHAASSVASSNGSDEAAIIIGDVSTAPAYHMEVGDKYTYRIRISSSRRGVPRVSKQCVYQVMNNTKEGRATKPTASGTGFVVTTDGYIATCAHVVAQATHVKVVIDGKSWPAKLVAQNTKADLALLKIDASGFVASTLGDSDQVELAETVRAFGYPLSDVLGTGLKVVTGSVSGIVIDPKDGGRRIQTDAPINPGNSGGPLVNGSGQVVGIASSKISSRVASSVGLAVPVNELRALLDLAKVEVGEMASPGSLSGPEIARAMRPAVAFIEVNGVNGKVFDLNYRVSDFFAKGSQGDQVQMLRQRLSGSMFSAGNRPSGEMLVGQFGNVVKQDGSSEELPFMLGPVNRLCLTPLDHLGRSEWSTEREVVLQLAPPGPTDLLSAILQQHQQHRQSMSPFGRRSEPKPVKLVPAEEMVKYERLSESDSSKITIRKTYSLVTLDSEQDPELEIKGTGETVFDTSVGVPVGSEYNAKVTRRSAGRTDVIPFTVKIEYISQEVIAAAKKKAAEELKRNTTTKTTKVVNPDGTTTTTVVTKTPTGTSTRSITSGTRRPVAPTP